MQVVADSLIFCSVLVSDAREMPTLLTD